MVAGGGDERLEGFCVRESVCVCLRMSNGSEELRLRCGGGAGIGLVGRPFARVFSEWNLEEMVRV